MSYNLDELRQHCNTVQLLQLLQRGRKASATLQHHATVATVANGAGSKCNQRNVRLVDVACVAEQWALLMGEVGIVDQTRHGRTSHGKNAATCLGCLEARIRNPRPVQQSRTDSPRHPADARLATGDRLRASADTVSNTGSTQKVARLAAWGGARP